jgi:hypothetical protein
MKPETIKIDGVEYVGKDAQKTPEYSGSLKIVILQRGWVMVGRLEKNGNDCKLHNAHVIRCWGTTKGLGELAEKGPLQNTKLDKCYGIVEFDNLTIVATVSIKEEIWKTVI